MPACILKGCPHKTGQKLKYPDVTLHPFPKNFNVIKTWIEQTGQDFGDIDIVAQKILEGKKSDLYRMCSCHFTADCYMTKGSKIVLKPSAVPTIFPGTSFPQSLHTVTSIHPLQTPVFRTDLQEATISKTIVRVISRLRSIHTQTELKVVQRDQYCNTEHWIRQRNVSTQTDLSDEETESTSPPTTRSRKRQRPCLEKEFPEPNLISPIARKPAPAFGTADQTKDYASERKFIIYESCLDELLSLISCQHPSKTRCNAPITHIKKNQKGSMISVLLTCEDNHQSVYWRSQPMENNVSLGNVQLAGSILYSGSSFRNVSELFSIFGIPSISESMYQKYQRLYLFPAIDYEWRREQREMQKAMEKQGLVVVADRQFDRLGHSAESCTYSFMDLLSKKIVNVSIDQLGPGKTSEGLEQSTFQTCLDGLLEKNVDVKMVTTEKHAGFGKLMATKYSRIGYQFDVWHLCKSLRKRLVLASRTTGCGVLGKWISSIINHLWYCTLTCNHDADLLIAKWLSLLHHIQNVHRFPGNTMYPKCEHKRISKMKRLNTLWLKKQDKAFQLLCNIVTAPQLLKDLRLMGRFCHTGALETYHRRMKKFRPSHISYGIDAMYARTRLAALSHNRNVQREHVSPGSSLVDSGDKRFRFGFPKQRKKRITNPVYDDVMDIMRKTIGILTGKLENSMFLAISNRQQLNDQINLPW